MKKIVKGNDFTLRIPVMKVVDGERVAFPLPSCTDVVVRIANQYKRVPLSYTIDVSEDNVILAKVEGDQISLGTYAVEVKGRIFGNDWRSNEYPQFQIVANNADADTEFSQTDEGDNSVEMDTALVILPPTVELSNLISEATESIKAVNATDSEVKASEEGRVKGEESRSLSEEGRVKGEESRVKAEAARENAETSRVSAETARVSVEESRVKAEQTREDNEATRKANETARISAETTRKNAEDARQSSELVRISNEDTRKANESARISAETTRQTNEDTRIANEKQREANETARQKTISDALSDFTAKEKDFDTAEASRVASEELRVKNEESRKASEEGRVKSEESRTANETTRQTTFDSLSNAMQTAIDNAQKAADANNATNDSIKDAETKRVDAENKRVSAEEGRTKSETARESNESARKTAETARTDAETARATAETKRAAAEDARTAAETKREADCKTAISNAEAATTKAEEATTKATTAATGAEKVNATIDGSTIKVTDRNGNVNTYELEEWAGDENVTIQIASEVEGFTLAGHNIFVYFNGSEDAHATYTTDSDGKVTFTATHGSYYKVVYPDIAECQSVPSATYVAVLPKRNISVTYQGYIEEDKLETITIIIRKYSDASTYTAWADVPVSVKIGTADAQTLTSDSDGKITFQVVRGTSFTVTADKYDGYYVHNDSYSYTYTAEEAYRYIHYNYHAFRTGVFIVHTDGSKYTAEEWTAGGFTQSEAVGVSVVTAELVQHDTVFTIDINALYSWSYPKKQWCETMAQFNDIALSGASSSNPNYYDGKTESELVLAEAEECTLEVPAFTYAKSQTLSVGGTTLTGFLGAVGQHYALYQNRTTLDECLTAVIGDNVNIATTLSSKQKWTSAQGASWSALEFTNQPKGDSKTYVTEAMPFFAY